MTAVTGYAPDNGAGRENVTSASRRAVGPAQPKKILNEYLTTVVVLSDEATSAVYLADTAA